jgi:hypothetical protein
VGGDWEEEREAREEREEATGRWRLGGDWEEEREGSGDALVLLLLPYACSRRHVCSDMDASGGYH